MATKKRKKKLLQIIGYDAANRRVALDNGWTYAEDQLVRWLTSGGDEVRELGARAPYSIEVVAKDGGLFFVADEADARPVGFQHVPPLPTWTKASTGDPSSDRSRDPA